MVRIIKTTHNDSRLKEIDRGLDAYNESFGVGLPEKKPVSFIAEADDGTFCGGWEGETTFDWLYISRLYVPEKRKGLGTALMKHAETYCHENGLIGITLFTLDIQAPGFYEKLGYEKFGEIPDFTNKYSRCYFYKRL